MKKTILIAFVLFFSVTSSLLAEREVMVRNAKTGVTTSMAPKVAEVQFQGDGWLILDDFEDGNLKNYLKGESGAWNLNPVDEDNANADIEVVETVGPDGKTTQALKVTYDVDSEVKAQNGFWSKLRDFDASEYDHLEFDVKCDEAADCSSLFRLELKKFKDDERVELIRGTAVIEGVGNEWKHVVLKLNRFTGLMDFGDPEVWANPSLGRRGLQEFVVVFKDRQVDKKSGAMLLDNIKFTQKNDPGPTAVDGPPRDALKTPPTHFKLIPGQILFSGKDGYTASTDIKNGVSVIRHRAGETEREVVYESETVSEPLQTVSIEVDGSENLVADFVTVKTGSPIAATAQIVLSDGSLKLASAVQPGDLVLGVDPDTLETKINTVLTSQDLEAVTEYSVVGVRLEGFEFQKYLVTRLRGFPTQTIMKKEFPEDGDEFLNVIAQDTWKFFDNIVDRENHLPLDTVQFAKEAPIYEKDSWVGDYTNITNIGMYLFAITGAYELGYIKYEDAVERVQGVVQTLNELPRHESGFYFNYYDTTTKEQTSYFISSVDSGWLAAGLIMVRNAFPETYEGVSAILNTQDFSFFYDEIDQQLSHGYYQHMEMRSDYNYGAFYTEPRATSFIGIGKGDIPVDLWFQSLRTFPDEYFWQSQEPINRVEKETLGVKYFGGFYKWKDHIYVPSWGGSLFEALMPTLVLDEQGLSPESLGLNGKVHAQMHADYAKEELGYPVWGMSPSSVPEGGYSEYGVKPLGSKGYKAGVVTPHVTGLAVPFIRDEAISNFRKLIELYDIYGPYGFYDSVTVETGLVAYKYLALDQGMLFAGLANYLTGGKLIEHFMKDEISQAAVPLLTEEKLFDPPFTKDTRVMRRKV
jgi:hypothetical protein